MPFLLFSSSARKSTEGRFWDWFLENEEMLFHFDRDQERAFRVLKTAISGVYPDLTFEFGPDLNGRREFVISADGLRDAFPAVESLYESAPSLPRWIFTKFRPRRDVPMAIEIDGLLIKHDDVEIAIEADGEKAGFTVFVRGLEEAQREQFSAAALILLDHPIGEYDMETKVGFIEIRPYQEPSEHKRHRLTDLPRIFDEFMQR